MKWLSRLRGKEEELPSTVAFEEIEPWLEQVTGTLFRDLNATAPRLYSEIEEIRERLKQDISGFQTADSTEEVPDRIAKIGLLSREKMTKHLLARAEKILIPEQTDYKTVWSFYQETISGLEFPFGKSQTNIYCVRSLFPNEIKEVIADLNRLRTALDQLVAPLKGKESQVKYLGQVPKLVGTIKELRAELERENEGVAGQEEECAMLEGSIESEKERLGRIEEKEEWKQYKAHETELSSLAGDLNELEANVHRMFTPLTKPLTLLKKQDETGRHTLSKEERNAIASILRSPMRALSEDITGSLRAVKTIIEENPGLLKDKKREQALNWIDRLLDLDLASITVKRERLETQIAELKAKLSDLSVLKEKEELEQSLASAQGQLTQLQEGIARSKGHITSLESALDGKKQRLLGALEGLTGKEIEITFNF